MASLRSRLREHLLPVLDGDPDVVAGQVLSIVRNHDDEYARSHPLAAEFRRLAVDTWDDHYGTGRGVLTEDSAGRLVNGAVREFGARGDGAPSADPETAFQVRAVAGLDELDEFARTRVMTYLADRYPS